MDASLHARLETAPTVWFCAVGNRAYGVVLRAACLDARLETAPTVLGRLEIASTVLVLRAVCLDARL